MEVWLFSDEQKKVGNLAYNDSHMKYCITMAFQSVTCSAEGNWFSQLGETF